MRNNGNGDGQWANIRIMAKHRPGIITVIGTQHQRNEHRNIITQSG